MNDVLLHLLWTKTFLKQQGYDCDTTFHQDNTSAILLETNGMESSSEITRHINKRLYFIKDHIIRQVLNVKQCSIDDILADFLSKLLQGSKFNKFKIYWWVWINKPRNQKWRVNFKKKWFHNCKTQQQANKKQIIKNRVALYDLTGVCWINKGMEYISHNKK